MCCQGVYWRHNNIVSVLSGSLLETQQSPADQPPRWPRHCVSPRQTVKLHLLHLSVGLADIHRPVWRLPVCAHQHSPGRCPRPRSGRCETVSKVTDWRLSPLQVTCSERCTQTQTPAFSTSCSLCVSISPATSSGPWPPSPASSSILLIVRSN